MRRPLPFPRLGRLLYLVGVLGVLTVPVSYQGGADVAHAHAIFQLWFDAIHGSTDHHRRWEDGHGARATELAKPPPVSTVVTDPDLPRLSELTPAHERPMIIAAATMLVVVLALAGLAVPWSEPVALTGRRPRPETPPPRLAVSPA